MAELENKRHEQFAANIAKGMAVQDAYVKAGFKPNQPRASVLSRTAEIKARVRELIGHKPPEALPLVPTCEDPQTMAELGYSKAWFANAYQRIASQAEEVGQLNVANTSLGKIQAMYEAERVETAGTPAIHGGGNRLDINALGTILDKVAGLIELSKGDKPRVLTHSDHKAHRATESHE